MYSQKMKVIGIAVVATALFLGVLMTFSVTNVVFAADQSSKPASQNPQLDPRVPGWCNWDGDQDKDDWCWTNTTISTTVPYTNGTALPAGTVYPYGAIIGQADPYQDAGYMPGYNNDNRYFLPRNLFQFRRNFNDGDNDADDVVRPLRIIRGRRILFGRNGFLILNNGKRVFYMP
jgi:hypothetical protein